MPEPWGSNERGHHRHGAVGGRDSRLHAAYPKLDRFGVSDLTWSRLIATTVLVAIVGVGATWGLKALEWLETYAVSLNIGVIVALLVGLGVHDASLAASGQLALPHIVPDADLPHAARVIMGLLVVVPRHPGRVGQWQPPCSERAASWATLDEEPELLNLRDAPAPEHSREPAASCRLRLRWRAPRSKPGA